MQVVAEISNQVIDIAGMHGAIIATKAAKAEAEAKVAGLSAADRLAARDALATGDNSNLTPTEADIQKYVYQTSYDNAYTQALNRSGFGTGGAIRQGIMAVSAAVQGLAGSNVAQAIAGAAAPYLATEIKKATTDAKGNVNIAANAVAHAVLGGIVAEASGNSVLAGAAGAATGELAARVIADRLYPGKAISEMTESEKQTVTTLSLLAGGLAAGTAGDSTSNAVAGAQAGRNAVENNLFGFDSKSTPQGLRDFGQSATSLYTNTNLTDENGNVLNPITEEERQYAMHRLVTGVMPEGQDISKAIVNGYTNGVLIAGAWYLGPAAALGKVVVGSALSGGANAAYQWYDLSQPKNINKTYDYWSTTAALVTGGLAPGRDILPNVGIAMGSAVFTDGPSVGAIGSAAAGSWAGGAFGKYAPEVVKKAIGSDPVPEFVYDFSGGVASEFTSGFIKDINKPASEGEMNK
ncbi:Putative large exoprotein involved in heme utilization or adhesion of ShlA/HecA/FhaA family [Pectobacterium sp. F1-1]|uniref:VENN motif pre-toxin domain-containing protein n=1 Tax=Pectobacterium sp. F1-1 TaxID=2949614 RepID=UPI0021D7B617|nr:VENN motif pre-toxin domain-containing protein [Pectobacterium sp. F1-1]UYA58699.1 Putative large exoprotein involved in heme utilization or adhesion of ShlA/HecA/FhaA family [Pectobacterium sp. F1-1]